MTNFKPTLAATIEHPGQIQFPTLVSPKLDGIRALGSAQGLLSRTLKPIPNLAIQEAYKFALAQYPILAQLDGELVIGPAPTKLAYWLNESNQLESGYAGDYNTNQSVIMSAHKRPISATWCVFDSYTSPGQPYELRLFSLRSDFGADSRSFISPYRAQLPDESSPVHGLFNVRILRHHWANTLEEIDQLEETYLAQGYEGLMLRHPQAPYKSGRSTVRQGYLCKLKRFLDAEATIVGFEERMSNQNVATKDARGYTVRSSHNAHLVGLDTLGVLVCEHPTWGQIKIGTGRGLTDQLRAHIWANQDQYLGRLVKFKYQPVGTLDKPRLPIYLGFRSPEDL